MVVAMRKLFLVLISALLFLSCTLSTPASAKAALAQSAPSSAAKDEKPAEQKPAEQKPAEQKPAEQKPAEQKPADASAQVPTISADRGDCSAAFTVLDGNGKPVYQASIHTLIRWGLAHKTDLTVSTNYYGKAQFTRLPNYAKNPIVFDVTAGDKRRIVVFDPGNRCKADFTVELR
jgi:uncharacterized low-complexity protein